MINKQEIIVLCDNCENRKDISEVYSRLLLSENYIPMIFNQSDYLNMKDIIKMIIHKSYAVVIMNDSADEFTEYIIDCAKKSNTFINYYKHPAMYWDDVRGFHHSGVGYSPKGTYCGECEKLSCRWCLNMIIDVKNDIINNPFVSENNKSEISGFTALTRLIFGEEKKE